MSDVCPAARSASRTASVCAPTAPGSRVGHELVDDHCRGPRRRRPDDRLDRVEQLALRLRRCRIRAAAPIPASTSWLRSAGVGHDTVHGGRDRVRVLGVEEEPGFAERLRYRGRRVRDDRDAVVHRLEQRDAESLVLARDHVHVGGLVVGGERSRADAAGDVDRVGEPERVDEGVQRAARIGVTTMRRRDGGARVSSYRRRYAANALTRSCCALFGASRPTNSQSIAAGGLRAGQPAERSQGRAAPSRARRRRAGSARRRCAGSRGRSAPAR